MDLEVFSKLDFYEFCCLLTSKVKLDFKTARRVILDNLEHFRNPDSMYTVKAIYVSPYPEKITNKEMRMIELFRSLLKLGANGDGLIFAIIDGNLQLVEFLLKSGAKLCNSELDGNSPASYALFKANIHNRKKMLKLLLQYGLDTSVRNKNGDNLLQQFIKYDFVECDNDAVEIAEILINSGVSPDEVNNLDRSSLHDAISQRSIPLVSLLIEKGANVNLKSKSGEEISIFLAVDEGCLEVILKLLASGADVNGTFCGKTGLHAACSVNDEILIRCLLLNGANISIKTAEGNKTPFSMLKPEEQDYNDCVVTMVKEFARLTFENISIHDEDMELIIKNPMAHRNFNMCMDELKQMASTIFYGSHSYYSILKKLNSIDQIAVFTKNEKFVSKFNENLEKFHCYKYELEKIMETAIQIKDRSEETQARINSIFCDILPDVVKTKLAKYLKPEDLPLP